MANLSLRLSAIADLVKSNAAVCDVGTDHGYLAIHLIKNRIASKVIAVDINRKPLLNARENIEKSGVSGIELRLCDGLAGIKSGEADTFIIAGMGGEVIAGIIERGADIAQNKNISLIMQPTTSPEFLRRFLCENGFLIQKETAVFENGKLYSVMLVSFTGKCQSKENHYYYIGEVSPLSNEGLMYIKKQLDRCLKCMQSLEKVPSKTDEYEYYKSVVSGIEKALY